MLNRKLVKIARPENKTSLSTKLRKQRFTLFKQLFSSVPLLVKILDVGGREKIWESEGFCSSGKDVEITILNVKETQVNHANVKAVVGDARNMKQYADNEFDVVFSNSVIEHVGNYEQQRQMACEVQRVSKRYFLQTPNRYFPIEPHFLFPFFQFLPFAIQMWLMTHFDLGWRKKAATKEKARALITSVRLLTKKEVLELFPNANLIEEKFMGLTKSFILYEGWGIKLDADKIWD